MNLLVNPMEKLDKKCPRRTDLELYLLEGKREKSHQKLQDDWQKKLEEHLRECTTCQTKYSRLENHYGILRQELTRPISNNIIDFVKTIEKVRYQVSFILLTPTPTRTNWSSQKIIHFQPKFLYEEPDTASIKPGQLLIRAVKDIETECTCFVLWALEPSLYKNVEIRFPGWNKSFFSNAMGIVKAGRIKDTERLLQGEVSLYSYSTK
ncbi:MAG: hypothetical protein ONB05_08990 [candidate division KSB1 bacterium]|nr:hypothetical protein [candidate division KSB1 bacterium]